MADVRPAGPAGERPGAAGTRPDPAGTPPGTEAGPALVADRVEQVLLDSASAHCWHALARALDASAPEPRNRALQAIAERAPREGVAGTLRATLLFAHTRDDRYLEEAGRILQGLRPVDADRSVTFANLVWAYALRSSPRRERFAAVVRLAGLPQLVAGAGEWLAESTRGVLPARGIASIRKVAVVAPHLSDLLQAPTALALNHAALLQRAGLTARLFAFQEQSVFAAARFLGHGRPVGAGEAAPDTWRPAMRERFSVAVSDPRFSLMARWRAGLGAVAEFDPDAVLFVGFASPFVFPLYAARPVAALSVHTVPPLAPCDVWLAADEAAGAGQASAWRPWLAPGSVVRHPWRLAVLPVTHALSRQALGLPADAVVLLSVGARLAREMVEPWAGRMRRFLETRPNVFWLIVGPGEPLPPALRGDALRVRVMPVSEHVRAITRCCDIYVNPPRMGGGFSVMEAMSEGLPVVTHAGSDGGDKAGASAVADDEAFFDLLGRLADDSALRRDLGSRMRGRFAETFDLEHAAGPLVSALEQAAARYAARVGTV